MKRNWSFRWHPAPFTSLKLNGMQIAIIGGTGGIGRALSRLLASRGASVLVVGRTFRDSDLSEIAFLKADLSLMREAKRVAEVLPGETLDLLVFTNGIFAAPKRQETAEGIERDMAVSYLSRLVILDEVAPKLGVARPGVRMKPRVFIMGYPGTGQTGTLGDLDGEESYSAIKVHMNTVAGNGMMVLQGAKFYPNASFFGLNPGVIKTNIRDNFLGPGSWKSRMVEGLIGLVMPRAETYAKRIVPLLVSSDLEGHSGAMFNNKGEPILPSPKLTDSYISEFLAASEAMVSRAAVRLAR
jgi:NAD(P)-dependent dehydrogenase (short-subunit alcohol dehydrogenase family)